MAETIDFELDQAFLKHVISGQSGTNHKAVLELIMNSLDGGASRCDVTIGCGTFEVSDDGDGFGGEEQFRELFRKFGFDHANHARTVGRFGVGRGQIMALSKVSWRTSDIRADVDIVNKGYRYELHRDLEPITGVTVSGEFYEAMNGGQLFQLESELKKLCRYAAIDIYINGTKVNVDPAKEKWDHECEHAYYRIRDQYSLSIYSQGFYVQDMSSYNMGAGGVVVTKRGSPLSQNLSRNDLRALECPIWKSVYEQAKKLSRKLREAGKEKKQVTDAQRAEEVAELMGSTDSGDDWSLLSGKFITFANGRHGSLNTLVRRGGGIVVVDSNDIAAEQLHNAGAVSVLSQRTLDRFRVRTASEFLELVVRRFKDCHYGRSLEKLQAHEALEDCDGYSPTDYVLVNDNVLDKPAKAVLHAIRKFNNRVACGVGCPERRLMVGQSNHAEGWTDGKTFIAINAEALKEARKLGIAGFHKLVALLVHEYHHDERTNMGHGHTPEFYSAFHESMFEPFVARSAVQAFAAFCKGTNHVTKPQLSELGILMEIDEPIADGSLTNPAKEAKAS